MITQDELRPMDNFLLEIITPENAQNMLTNNIVNRPICQHYIESLVNEILNDNWVINGESIKFDNDGRLIDGQHRLNAVISAKKAIQTYVLYGGIDNSSFETIDSGRKRTASDVLHIKGETNCILLAAAARLVYRWERGELLHNIRISNKEIIKIVNDYPELREYTKKIHNNIGIRRIIPESIAVFLYFVFSKSDKQKADKFFDKLSSGAMLEPSSPILLLLNRLIENRGAALKLKSIEICALIIKAWNAFIKDKTLKRLQWDRKGKEEFPTIK